jgi:asparagine synthase (glutamine-hydrolysing)
VGGVCGILRFDGEPVLQRDLDRQMDALAHLGPDGARTFRDGPIGLGGLSLQVTREDLFDVQPLYEPDAGILLVADLRLDNREELAKALAIDAEALSAAPDSALLLAAYRRWGGDCASHLLGDFAFAVWDARARKLTLGRDHMGQRHLFYHHGDGFLAFATEIKGLWALPDVPRALSDVEIGRMLLADQDRRPGSTRFQGIQALPGGVVVSISADGALTQQRYWEPRADPVHLDRSEAYYLDAYRWVLAEAVACRLRRATRPAGLFFSGGFDSAAIAALASPALQQPKLVTVTSALPAGSRGAGRDPRRWVELCAGHMPHLDVRYVTGEGVDAVAGLEGAFLANDGPGSPNRYITGEMYRTVAAAGARVVMDGHGGDYTLNPRVGDFLAHFRTTGQIRRFVVEFFAQRRHHREPLWRSVKRDLLFAIAPRRAVRAWRNFRIGLSPVGPTLPVSRTFARAAKAAGANTRGEGPAHKAAGVKTEMERAIRRIQDGAATGGSIPAAAVGLEFTQPYHDKRVVELALAIPETLYFRDGRPRHLARTALRDLLPIEFQTRSPANTDLIPGFMAMANTIQPEMLAEIDRLEKQAKLARYFNFPKMRKMLVQRPGARRNARFETRTRQATLAFIYARYIEWFSRENA